MNSSNESVPAAAGHFTTRVAIIGAGFGGLCMAARLKQAGIHDFLILEKADEVGGTWRENTYPGAECDVASALYSYSFAPNPTWEFKWATQKQILDYLRKFACDFEITPHLRFGKTVTLAAYDERTGRWRVQTQTGEQYDCQFLVTAVGQLHHPRIPEFPGQASFNGPAFHSAEWQHEVDLNNKSVAVIGNAASAVQLIPELARSARSLTIYQRSANWVIPKGNRPHSPTAKLLARAVPGLAKLHRLHTWVLGEYFLYPMIRGARIRKAAGEWVCKREIAKHIRDPELRASLLPDYPIGAKRILLSDKYYPSLALDNVELVRARIGKFTRDAIVTADGTERAHDAIVYATGFRTNPFLQSIQVTGRNGCAMNKHWQHGAYAYLGVMTSNYPNLFMMYGPNTNTGHSSVVFFHEAQAGLIMQLMNRAGAGRIEVNPDAEDAFNDELQRRLQALAWSKVEASWYKDGQRITNNWPGSAREYARRARKPIWPHFMLNAA